PAAVPGRFRTAGATRIAGRAARQAGPLTPGRAHGRPTACQATSDTLHGGTLTDQPKQLSLHCGHRHPHAKEQAMHKSPLLANPFALMMEPEAVMQAIEQARSQDRKSGA